MSLEALLQPMIFGLQMGLIYVLMALGLAVIFSIMNVLNLAHGEFYMLGAVSVYSLASAAGMNYVVALVLSIIAVAVLGVVLERVFFRPAGGEVVPTVIVAVGLMWILQSVAQVFFGREAKGMSEAFFSGVSILNVNVSGSRISAILISLVLIIATYFFIYRTKQGRAMQAVAQDREAAALQGVDLDRIGTLGFALGCGLAAAAGGVMAPIFSVNATMGTPVLVTSLSVVILGGMGSIPGAVLGGLILGLLESYGSAYLGYGARTFPFLIIIVVLLVRRHGLMGRAA